MFLRAPSFPLLAALVAVSEVTTAAPSFPREASNAARAVSRPNAGNVPYGREILSCVSPGKIALTFDDGPGPLTAGIVDTLDENGVPGTFFVVGKNGPHGLTTGNYDSLIKHMHDNGHQIASHSFSHPDFATISYDEKIKELEKNEKAIADIIGVVPTYFRSPYTSCDDECYKALGDMGYHVTDYDLDTKDWLNGGAESKSRYSSAVKAANPRSSSFIVLAHDVQDSTANGLVQYMIDIGLEKGFKFVTLGECLGDPSGNWYRDPQSYQVIGGGGSDYADAAAPYPTASPHAHIELGPEEPLPSDDDDDDDDAASSSSSSEGSAAASASSTQSGPTPTTTTTSAASAASASGVSSSGSGGTSSAESASATGEADSTADATASESSAAASASASGSATPDGESAAGMPVPALGLSVLSSLVGVAAWVML